MTTESTTAPCMLVGDLETDDIVDRHRHEGVTVDGIRNATIVVHEAINAAFDADAHGLAQEQFTQLACNCFYMQLFEAALTGSSLQQMTADLHERIAKLSA